MICWIDTETTGLNAREGHLLEVALVVTDDHLNELGFREVVCKPVGAEIDQVFMDQVVRDMHTKNGLLEEVRVRGMRRHEAEEILISFLTKPCTSCNGEGWVVRQESMSAPERDVCLENCMGQQGTLAGNLELDYCKNCKKKCAEHQVLCDIPRCVPEQMTAFTPKVVTVASQTPLAGSTVGFDRAWIKEHMPTLEALFSYRSIDVSSLTEIARRWNPAVYEARPKAVVKVEDRPHRALADVRESINYLRYFRDCKFVGAGAPPRLPTVDLGEVRA